MRKTIVAVSLMGWLVVANAAEEKKPFFIGEDPGPVYTQMVSQWAQATNFAKNASDVAVAKLKADMQRDPKLAKIVSPALTADLEQFFYELFASRETTSDLAKLYSQYFTLDEMNELVKFYKTPLGVKLIKTNPELTIKSQQIGANLFKKHESEYIKVLAKYMAPEALPKPKSAQPVKVESTVEPKVEPKPQTPAPKDEPKADPKAEPKK
ncbi:MAG: DUF2059 domain-containing protein [Candidatus Berkiella sp.]